MKRERLIKGILPTIEIKSLATSNSCFVIRTARTLQIRDSVFYSTVIKEQRTWKYHFFSTDTNLLLYGSFIHKRQKRYAMLFLISYFWTYYLLHPLKNIYMSLISDLFRDEWQKAPWGPGNEVVTTSNISSRLLRCITTLNDWFKIFSPLFQPTISKTKTNRNSLARAHFPHFVNNDYMYLHCFEVWLADWINCVICAWLEWLHWF